MNTDHRFNSGKYWGKKVAFFVILAPLFILAFGYFVMTLWNFTLPAIFGVSTITFWQAIALFILSKILFSGFRGGWGHKPHGPGAYWGSKWKSLSDEERNAYREKWQQWCRKADDKVTAAETPKP